MKERFTKGYLFVWAISVCYGIIVIPLDFLITSKLNSFGSVVNLLLAFRSSGLIMLMVAILTIILFIIIKILTRIKPERLEVYLQQAILIVPGIFVIVFFFLFDRLYIKSDVLVAVEIIGAFAALLVGGFSYYFLRSGSRSQWLVAISPKVSVIGTLLIILLFGISFVGGGKIASSRKSDYISTKSDRPNILLIVMDTVRADHLSLYGYHLNTTPFLTKMAKESTVFTNAFAASPWTLPSHASLFTGLYPSQHNCHGEHFWLDNSFRTLAEVLYDKGYQTINFSNNGYITSYHNMTQGFERTWYKGRWADDITMLKSLGSSVVSFFNWLLNHFQNHILAKIIKNPVSYRDSPKAAITNNAISEWLDHDRDKNRPFFIFINYMDAHLPYNPNDKVARLFLDETNLKRSYREDLRFPPIEHCLDLAKSGYTKTDIEIIRSLYDACIRYLDGELKSLIDKLKHMGIYDKTLVIITSDHGEYLGTKNRLAHGLGLNEEVLHVPLIARYPNLFKAGAKYDTMVTHIDIPETILSFVNIKERPEGIHKTQLLYDLKEDFRPNVLAEFRFPLHLLINASLLDDNSKWFIEQKTIRNKTDQFIWKSRGEPELYNVVVDPLQHNNLYSKDKEKADKLSKQLATNVKSLYYIPRSVSDTIGVSKKEKLELLDQLRGIGYVK
jgi:arylsulfatase A-like enzyme